MTEDLVKGGCFCGAIRYEFTDGEYPVANCHCTMCRRTSGAAFVTWLVVPESDFRYSDGTPVKLQSSGSGIRDFCGKCGTPVVCVSSEHPEIVDVTLGSLDHPEVYKPSFDVFEDTRLAWTKPAGE